MALGQVLARLSVELGLDTAAFSTGARKAQRSNKDLGDSAEAMGRRVGGAAKAIAIAGAAVAGAFVLGQIKDAIKSSIEYASSLGETAQQLGVTTKALQEFRYAAQQNGVAQEEIDKGLQRLTKTVGLAAGGNKAAIKAFADLGVNVRDAGGNIKATDVIFEESAGGLVKLKSSAEQMAAGSAILGKSFGQLLPIFQLGKEGIGQVRAEAQRLGVVLSEKQIGDLDKLADNLAKLNLELKVRVAGVVGDNATSILALVDGLIKLGSAAGSAAIAYRRYRLEVGLKAAENVADGGLFVSWEAQAKARVQAGQFQDALDQLDGKGGRLIRPAGKTTRPVGPRPTTGFGAPVKLNLGPKRRDGKVLPAAGFDPFKTKFAANDIDVQAGRNTEALAALVRMAGAAEAAAGRIIPALTTLDAATATTREQFEKLGPVVQSLFDRLFPAEAASREYELGLAAIRAELDKGTISAERFEEARRRMSIDTLGGDLNTPVGESVYQNADAIVPDLDKVSQGLGKFKGLADTTAAGVEIANVRVVRSFADTAQAVLGSLQQLADAIKGGGFLNILSALLGLGIQLGGIGAFGKTIQTNINRPVPSGGGSGRYPGYASGTMSAARGLALVGERGPELVRFAGGERVFPNGTGPGGGGGSSIQVIPSPYFNVVVDGRIVGAAPGIIDGGARVAASRGARAQGRRLA